MVRWCWVNFQCRGVLLIWIRVGQGPTALAIGEGGCCLVILTLVYHFSFLSPSRWEGGGLVVRWCWVNFQCWGVNLYYSRARAYCACSRCGWGLFGNFYSHLSFSLLSPSLWETARYRLKYCLKGPLSPKQPTNQPSLCETARYRLKYCLKGPLSAKQPTNQPYITPSSLEHCEHQSKFQFFFSRLCMKSGNFLQSGQYHFFLFGLFLILNTQNETIFCHSFHCHNPPCLQIQPDHNKTNVIHH